MKNDDINPVSLKGLALLIGTRAHNTFDTHLAKHIDSIAESHEWTVGSCSMGHQYSDEFEACAEYVEAYQLAVAWLLGELEAADGT